METIHQRLRSAKKKLDISFVAGSSSRGFHVKYSQRNKVAADKNTSEMKPGMNEEILCCYVAFVCWSFEFAEQKMTWNSAAAGIKVRGCNLATVMRTDNAEI